MSPPGAAADKGIPQVRDKTGSATDRLELIWSRSLFNPTARTDDAVLPGTRWRWHPELLGTPVPRYTSYPTVAEFNHDLADGNLGTALDGIGANAPISLYLHIPYCHEICWYCGCNTGAANRSARLESYLEALHREIALAGARLGGRGRIRRIAFGGGSPNAIAPQQFDALVDAVDRAFVLDAPVLSVEIDPRGFDQAWAQALRRNKVTRASLGVQTFDPRIQSAIGRVQPLDQIRAAMEHLTGAGVDSINFDLMYGLPGQTDASLRDTLDTAIAMRPARLAVFGYAHVPHLIPRQRRIDAGALPDARARFDQAELAWRRLTGAGYMPIGFDHFALPDDPLARAAGKGALRRNFQGFTEDPSETLIGLGASAISSFPDRLLQNEKGAGRYREHISAGRFASAKGVVRDAEDRLRGRVIERLLTAGAAALPGEADWSRELAALERFRAHGLMAVEGSSIRLLPGALPYARTIAAVFDRHRGIHSRSFSSAV